MIDNSLPILPGLQTDAARLITILLLASLQKTLRLFDYTALNHMRSDPICLQNANTRLIGRVLSKIHTPSGEEYSHRDTSRTIVVLFHKFRRCYLVEDADRYFESIHFQWRDYTSTPACIIFNIIRVRLNILQHYPSVALSAASAFWWHGNCKK